MARVFGLSKPVPIDTLLPARSHLLNFAKQPLTTGDQVFKCPRHLGDSSFKPPCAVKLLFLLIPLFVVFVHVHIHMHVWVPVGRSEDNLQE